MPELVINLDWYPLIKFGQKIVDGITKYAVIYEAYA